MCELTQTMILVKCYFISRKRANLTMKQDVISCKNSRIGSYVRRNIVLQTYYRLELYYISDIRRRSHQLLK